MGNMIERPTYYEGQMLGGGDLNAAVDHARGQMARHERYLHLWGIAEGLELVGEARKTSTGVDYKEVTVKAGIAIDASGREIVVAQDTRLASEDFESSNVSVGQAAGEAPWYPVFLTGLDAVAPPAVLAIGQCGIGQPSRLREEFRLEFGRPGDENAQPDATAVGDGPGPAAGRPARVLLGFVSWLMTPPKFKDTSATNDEALGRRYAGVRADVVAARGGRLALRTTPEVQKSKPGLAISEDGGGLLAFGPMTTTGEIGPVFSVNAKGDLKIAGKFTGAVTPGTVQVESGIVMDGLLVPLPPGITQEMLDDGKAIAHVQVTARHPALVPTGVVAADWIACPVECRVDADRRVRCIHRWIELKVPGATGTAFKTLEAPGACDYVVLVNVPAG
jgi:hypothetical protein